MALQKQKITITAEKKLNTVENPQITQGFHVLENVRYNKFGEITKRNAYNVFDTYQSTKPVRGLVSETPLIVDEEFGGLLQKKADTTGFQQINTKFRNVLTESDDVISDRTKHTWGQRCRFANTKIIVDLVTEEALRLYVTVTDSSGAVISGGFVANVYPGYDVSPNCMYFAPSDIWIVAYSVLPNQLSVFTINNNGTFSPTIGITPGFNVSAFDMCYELLSPTTSSLITWCISNATTGRIYWATSTQYLASFTSWTIDPNASALADLLSICQYSSNQVHAILLRSTTVYVKNWGSNNSLATITPALVNVNSRSHPRIVCTSFTNLEVFWLESGTNSISRSIAGAKLSPSTLTILTAYAQIMPNVRWFTTFYENTDIYDYEKIYIVGVAESYINPSSDALKTAEKVNFIGAFDTTDRFVRPLAMSVPLAGCRGGSYIKNVKPAIFTDSNGFKYISTTLRYWAGDVTVAAPNQEAKSIEYRYYLNKPYVATQHQGYSFFPDGCANVFDGRSIYEPGLIYQAVIGSITQSATGGSMSNGTYYYKCFYSFVDNKGNLQFFYAPMKATSIVLTGGTATQKVDLKIVPLMASNYARTQVNIEIYRTQNGGATYQRCGVVANDPSQFRLDDGGGVIYGVSFTDTMSDATLATQQDLINIYGGTTGFQANYASESSMVNGIFNDHILKVTDFYPKRIYFSRRIKSEQTFFGYPLTTYIDVPCNYDITALIQMDEKLVIFTENEIWITAGDGFDETGKGGVSIPSKIPCDIGTFNNTTLARVSSLNPNSPSSGGILFASTKGIYILNRSLQLDFIGANVDEFYKRYKDYRNNGVVRIIDISKERQMYVVLTDDPNNVVNDVNARFSRALIYDYYYDAWLTDLYDTQNRTGNYYTDIPTNFVAKYQEKIVFVCNNTKQDLNLVKYTSFFELSETLSDTTTLSTYQTIITPWFSLAQINGFQRIYSMYILGKTISPDFSIEVEYGLDSNPYWQPISTPIRNTSTGFQFIDRDYYRTENKPGLPYYDSPLELKFNMPVQKCSSIRFKIRDNYTYTSWVGSNNGGLSLTGISLEVGIKDQMHKIDLTKVG